MRVEKDRGLEVMEYICATLRMEEIAQLDDDSNLERSKYRGS